MLCGAAPRGEVRAQRGTFLRGSIVISAGVPGLAENWEEFIIIIHVLLITCQIQFRLVSILFITSSVY